VNAASMKTKHEKLTALIDQLRTTIAEKQK